MEHIKNFFCGMIIGIANVIPGVSGGTMAVILNIYDKILMAFSLQNLKKHIFFLGCLGAGAVFGIIAFSGVITYLYDNFYMVLNFCFIGLVLGSIPMIYGRAKFQGVQAKNWIPFIITLIFMIGITIIKMMDAGAGATEMASRGVESLPFNLMLVWLFISAFISTIAMILPGISGSFMLLLFGCYTLIMKSIVSMDMLILIVAGIGILSGGFVGVKLVKIMLRKHPQAMYFAILGLMVGSIISIYPGFNMTLQGGLAILGMLICTGVSYMFGRLSNHE